MTSIQVYDIDSGVPVPERNTSVNTQVPINKLEVGDSILFPLSIRANVQTLASRLKQVEDKDFTIKKMDDKNARVWRIK